MIGQVNLPSSGMLGDIVKIIEVLADSKNLKASIEQLKDLQDSVQEALKESQAELALLENKKQELVVATKALDKSKLDAQAKIEELQALRDLAQRKELESKAMIAESEKILSKAKLEAETLEKSSKQREDDSNRMLQEAEQLKAEALELKRWYEEKISQLKGLI